MTALIILDCGDELEIKGVVSVREKGGKVLIRRQHEERKCTVEFWSDEIVNIRIVTC